MTECLALQVQEKAIGAISLFVTHIIYPGIYPPEDLEMGSGTFVIIHERKGILTCHHVLEIFSERNLGYVQVFS